MTLYATGIGPGVEALNRAQVSGAVDNVTLTSTPADGAEINMGFGPYNGLVGVDPEPMITLSATLTVDDPGEEVGEGMFLVWPFGPIYVRGASEDQLIYDTFVDADGTLLDDHTPDTQPVGGVAGWMGSACNNNGSVDSAYGSAFVIGGNSGNRYAGRLYSGLNDDYCVYADIRREGSGVGDRELGISIRNSQVTGVVDTAVDTLRFYEEYNSATTANLTWSQVSNLLSGGGDGSTLTSQVGFTSVAWAQWGIKRLLMHVSGATVRLYSGDSAGAGNYTLHKTFSLTTAWNDASHQYCGLTYTHLDQGAGFALFGSSQISLGISPSGQSAVCVTGYSDSTGTVTGVGSVFHIPLGFPVSDLTSTTSYVDGTGWLEVSMVTTTSPTDVTMVCNAASATTGVQRAVVTFDSPDTDNVAQDMLVSFLVTTGVNNGTAEIVGAPASLLKSSMISVAATGYEVTGSEATVLRYAAIDAASGEMGATLADVTLAKGHVWGVGGTRCALAGARTMLLLNGWGKPDAAGDSDWTEGADPDATTWTSEWRPRAKLPTP